MSRWTGLGVSMSFLSELKVRVNWIVPWNISIISILLLTLLLRVLETRLAFQMSGLLGKGMP